MNRLRAFGERAEGCNCKKGRSRFLLTGGVFFLLFFFSFWINQKGIVEDKSRCSDSRCSDFYSFFSFKDEYVNMTPSRHRLMVFRGLVLFLFLDHKNKTMEEYMIYRWDRRKNGRDGSIDMTVEEVEAC